MLRKLLCSAFLAAALPAHADGFGGGGGPTGPTGPTGASGGSLALTNVAFVSPAGSDVTGNGSIGNPYATPAYAVSQLMPAPTNITQFETKYLLHVFPGVYSGTITVPSGRLTIVCEGGCELPPIAWNVKLSEQYSSTYRSDLQLVSENLQTTVGTLPQRQSMLIGDGTNSVMLTVPIGDAPTSLGLSFDHVVFYGILNDVNQNAVLAMLGSYSDWRMPSSSSTVINATLATMTNLYQVNFNAPIILSRISKATEAVFNANVTVSTTASTPADSGLRGCAFSASSKTWTGPGNLILDSVSNNSFMVHTWSLAGGATKVFLDQVSVASGKTPVLSNSFTLAGTDATTMTFPAASDTLAGLATAETFTAVQTFQGAGNQVCVNTATATDDQLCLAGGAGGAARLHAILKPADITTSDKTITVPNWTGVMQVPTTVGTTSTVLHGNASGQPVFGAVVQGDVTNGYVDLSSAQTVTAEKTFSADIISTTASQAVVRTLGSQSYLFLDTTGDSGAGVSCRNSNMFVSDDGLGNSYGTITADAFDFRTATPGRAVTVTLNSAAGNAAYLLIYDGRATASGAMLMRPPTDMGSSAQMIITTHAPANGTFTIPNGNTAPQTGGCTLSSGACSFSVLDNATVCACNRTGGGALTGTLSTPVSGGNCNVASSVNGDSAILKCICL